MERNEHLRNIKIAIHNRKGSFSDHWIRYCDDHNIPYKIVNCYESDIISQLFDCNGLMWHWSHTDYRAQNFAKQLVASVENLGLKVFPNTNTCWHFDDKVGQKYLLESIGAPSIPTYVFYDKVSAMNWVNNVSFPKVLKLRGGAGSANVKLVKSVAAARRYVQKAFRGGFPAVSKTSIIKDRMWVVKRDKTISSLIQLLKGFIRIFTQKNNFDLLQSHKGYVYFQDFIPGNISDTRVYVFGDIAFALIRYNRDNDFRASGSGVKSYDPHLVNKQAIEVAFSISDSFFKIKLGFS